MLEVLTLVTLGRDNTSVTTISALFSGGIAYDFAFFEGFDLSELLKAIIRLRVFRASPRVGDSFRDELGC